MQAHDVHASRMKGGKGGVESGERGGSRVAVAQALGHGVSGEVRHAVGICGRRWCSCHRSEGSRARGLGLDAGVGRVHR